MRYIRYRCISTRYHIMMHDLLVHLRNTNFFVILQTA